MATIRPEDFLGGRMSTRIKFPLRHISPRHPHWDRVNLGTNWYAHSKRLTRVKVANLIGVQASVRGPISNLHRAKRCNLKVTDWRRPINVIRIGGIFYIRDGHNRVNRALVCGRKSIMAWVITL